MNYTAHAVTKEADSPCYDDDHSQNVQEISHFYLWLNVKHCLNDCGMHIGKPQRLQSYFTLSFVKSLNALPNSSMSWLNSVLNESQFSLVSAL